MHDQALVSTYFHQINSNVRYDDHSPEAERKKAIFVEGLKRVYLTDNILNMIIVRNEEDIEEEIPKPTLIQSIEAKLNLEVGDERNFYHCHILLTIRHHSAGLMYVSNRVADYFKHKYGVSFYVSPAIQRQDFSFQYDRYLQKRLKRLPQLVINNTLTYLDGEADVYFKNYNTKKKLVTAAAVTMADRVSSSSRSSSKQSTKLKVKKQQ